MENTLLFDFISKHLPELDEKTAIQVENKKITYKKMDEMIKNLASFLIKKGIKKDERVVVYLNKSPEYIISFLAVTAIQAIAVPIEIGTSKDRFNYILDETTPVRLIGEIVNDLSIPQNIVAIDWETNELTVDNESIKDNFEKLPIVKSDDPAAIFFSSGSTGRPKGVLLKQIHLVSTARNLGGGVGMDKNHRDLILSPINHTDGWQRVGGTLYYGGTAILYQGDLSVIGMLEDIEKYDITGFYTPPPLIRYLLLSSTEKVQKATKKCISVEIGSAPISKPEIAQLFEKIPTANVFIHFGLTESSRATLVDTKNNPDKWHTVGKPLPGVEIIIASPEGEELPPNTEGEILFRGIQCTREYWNRPDLNISRYRDGWLLSGDFGKMDEQGYLTYCGRKDDMITSGGYHYFPAEVETELGPVDGIEKYTIAGVKDSNGILEQIPVAFVVPQNPETWEAKDFMTQAKKGLPSYMVPRKVIKVDDLPLTPSGKVDRTQTVLLYFK